MRCTWYKYGLPKSGLSMESRTGISQHHLHYGLEGFVQLQGHLCPVLFTVCGHIAQPLPVAEGMPEICKRKLSPGCSWHAGMAMQWQWLHKLPPETPPEWHQLLQYQPLPWHPIWCMIYPLWDAGIFHRNCWFKTKNQLAKWLWCPTVDVGIDKLGGEEERGVR